MIRDYSHLIGRDFVWGTHDCYGLLRDFYRDVFDIEMPDFARPDDFWSAGLDLFGDHHMLAGFQLMERLHPNDYQFGDVFISAIQSNLGNHASIMVEDGKILHHLYGGLSRLDNYRGLIRNTTIGIYRHRDVKLEPETETSDIRNYLSPSMQKKLDEFRSRSTEPSLTS